MTDATADGRSAPGHEAVLAEAWAAVTGEVSGAPPLPEVVVDGTADRLPSRFRVEDMAVACVGAALGAAAALAGGSPGVRLHRDGVALAVTSEQHLRVDGRPAGPSFAPLSRFWAAEDGWVRTHANYPWHRAALLRSLDLPEDATVDDVAAAVAVLTSAATEDRVVGAGGVAASVRTLAQWQAHPQGSSVTGEPLVAHATVDGARPRRPRVGGAPAAGVRVLDLTRVIAGPVCTRYLGALGADVLRLDPPGRPDLAPGSTSDTLLAKRSAGLDLGDAAGRARLDELVGEADILVCGYRPGSLDRFGLEAGAVAERHPGLVVVVLDAWGWTGPWSGRRGFDSIVQAASGIAADESDAGGTPGALPCQILDHGTGYLAAAAALAALGRQRDGGGTHVRRLSLARTAAWLTGLGPARPAPGTSGTPGTACGDADGDRWTVRLGAPGGRGEVSAVVPPGSLGGEPLRWPGPPATYLADEPSWSS